MLSLTDMKERSFLQLMGKGKRCWKHVQSSEDQKNLQEFEELFLKSQEKKRGLEFIIPQIIHFVWLGNKPYPQKSKQNLKTWENFHPNWKVQFWDDHNVDSQILGRFQGIYEASDNFGEKSDIIRLLVLDKMGGVYVDHDMECRHCFDEIHKTYPFYGGLLTPGNPVIQRSAILRNSIIGAKKGHPILKKALEIAEERWDRIGNQFPGADITSTKKRVTLRVFASFHEAVLEAIRMPEFDGIIYPAGYFNEIERDYGLYTKEEMVGAWYTEEMTHHEEYLKKRLHKMMKRTYFLVAILGVTVLALFICVILLWMKIQ